MLRLLFFFILLLPSLATANNQLVGVWQSAKENTRLDILDGFKPNRGAVLSIAHDNKTDVGSWEMVEADTKLTLGWRSAPVRFITPDSFEWANAVFNRKRDIVEDEMTLLKEDENAFIDKMTKSVWLTSTKGQKAEFKSTFSIDSGVAELYEDTGKLAALRTWGISSGVLKIGNNVLVEARISESYLIGQNPQDKFVVYLATRNKAIQGRIDLAKQREEFLSKLLTDSWQRRHHRGYVHYKFRTVEGPLKGRVLRLENDSFEGARVWEYSPATGALKIGYTNYVGGVVIGNTLALLNKDGEQEFYQQRPDGEGKTFAMSDVEVHRINETNVRDLKAALGDQFQLDDYLYSFEFKEDNRTGYIHQWRSIPFTVVGQQLASDAFGKAENLYSVEEYLIFDDRFALRRDATASRLRTKTDAEVAKDQQEMETKLKAPRRKSIVLRITDLDGNVQDVTLPYGSLAEIAEMQIMAR